MNALSKEALVITPARDIAARVKALDWERVSKDLDAQGNAMIADLITREECDALAELYPVDGLFRSRVVMGRHAFGRGEYKYFSYPLPSIVAGLGAGHARCVSGQPATRRQPRSLGASSYARYHFPRRDMRTTE